MVSLSSISIPALSSNCYLLDGPALRITALTSYAKFLIAASNASYVSSTIWPLIQRDANYIQNTWSQPGYDLWEELNSFSFFTTRRSASWYTRRNHHRRRTWTRIFLTRQRVVKRSTRYPLFPPIVLLHPIFLHIFQQCWRKVRVGF